MSFDFDTKPTESDPTADFLARERSAAGALEGDTDLFGGGPSGGAGAGSSEDKDFAAGAAAFPSLDGEDDFAPTSATTARPPTVTVGNDDDDGLDGWGSGNAAAAAQTSRTDERGDFERNFPDLQIDDEPTPAPSASNYQSSTNGFMAPPVQSTMGFSAPVTPTPASTYGYGLNTDGDAEDPPAIKEWRDKQRDAIAARDAAAERRKGEAISKAEQDIDRFYKEYNEMKEKNIRKNKETEAAFQSSREQELGSGTTWSRIAQLVDLQNSQSKTIARSGAGATELGRMKEILLSLKREGESAPAAGGY